MNPSFCAALRKVKEGCASNKLFNGNDPTVIAALEAAQNAKHVMQVIYAAHEVINGETENQAALVKVKKFKTQFTRRQWGKLFHAADQNSELKRFAKEHVDKKAKKT
jgi:hypothetical protein